MPSAPTQRLAVAGHPIHETTNTPASEIWLHNRNRLLKLGMEHLQGVADLELLLKVALQASAPVSAHRRSIFARSCLTAGKQ